MPLYDKDQTQYDELTQYDKIRKILTGCYAYWVNRQIEYSQVESMTAELKEHLLLAVRDGKTVEAVVGDDVEAFAREWAQGMQTTPGARISNAICICLLACDIILIPQHVIQAALSFPLIQHGLSFPFNWTLLLLSALLAGFLFFLISGTGAFGDIAKHGRKRFWIMAAYILGMAALSQLLSWIHADQWLVLWTWQWWMSLVLIVVTVVASKIRRALDPTLPGGFIRFVKIGTIGTNTSQGE